MRSLLFFGLAALAAAQNTTTTSTGKASAVTVATDGSAQFTAINAAVSYAQVSGYPTVSVLAGTYSETVTIQGTATVTIAGPTATSYTDNQVAIVAAPTATGVVRFNTNSNQGVTFKNVNITNNYAVAGSKAPAVSMTGMNMAFYGCSLVSTGTGVYTASYGTTLIANSYIEGTDKLFYNYVTLYVYGSTIVPTASSASLFYAQGAQIGTTWYNASLVVDSSAVQQKPGASNTLVYLGAPNGNYTRAIYRGTRLDSLVAATALRSTVCSYLAWYGEYDNSGAQAMTSTNQASRAAVCDNAWTTQQMSQFSIDQIFGSAFSGYASSSTSWIDSTVLAAIQSSDASQVAAVGSSSTSTSSISSSSTSSVTSSTPASSSASSSSTGSSSSGSSSSSSAGSSSVPGSSTTTSTSTSSSGISVVTVAPSSAQFSDIGAAVTYAQNSAIPTVTVLAGTYSAFTIAGTKTVTIVGPTASSVADNQVLVTSSGTTGSLVIGSSGSLGATFRYLNFTNTATSSSAPAVAMRGIDMGFYTCALISSGGTVYSASLGFSLIANSYVSGTDKLFYNYPTVYLYNSTIVPTAGGSSILYAKGTAPYNSTLIVDSSTVAAPAGSTISNVYLATANGAVGYLTAIYRNSALGSLISAGGVYSTSCSVVGNFGEFANTGAGSYASNSASRGSASCDYSLSASAVSQYNISSVFGNSFSPYGNSNTDWIDASVLAAIQSSDAAQVASASTSSASSTVSATGTSSASSIATCATPTPSATLYVSQNATACQYSNVSAAIAALPSDGKPYTISISAGTYVEQLSITRNGKVTLIGQTSYTNDYSQNQVTIEISNGQLTSAGKDESTPVINAKKTGDNSGLALYNIDFVNTYPQTANTAALAADFYGADIAAYGCSFVGFQDTLLANKGTQVFSNCYIEGSIDYIWGYSTAYFHQCKIATNTPGACVSAQGRVAGTVSGYVFDTCLLTYTSTYGSSYGLSFLGRPYSNFSTAVYMNSYIDQHIAAAGWHIWSTSAPQTSNVTFGEYNNTGPGSWQATTARASFATNFTASQASAYSLANWIGDTSWIDTSAYNAPVSWTFPNGTSTTTSSGSTSTATAIVNAHPNSGTVPPTGAVLVSPNGEVSGSYASLTAALASLPADSTNQTVFMYSGSYYEQIPAINRAGAVRIIGYTTGNPGQSYADNTVTITYNASHLLSSTTGSDEDSATFTTESNNIALYNINMINTNNINGAVSNDITLAANVEGTHIGFYACSFDGWQDTLLTYAVSGYQYFESCYIGGAIDFIWGYSKAYFKGCTIGAKRSGSCMTAQSRASSTAIGGYIFDQCLLTYAPDETADITGDVYMGRPYSQYAKVVVKYSYIDDVINPVGWKIWSATDPRTAYITFAEYNNTGPSNWENNVAARESFGNATLLTSDTYTLAAVMDSTSWIDMTYWNSIVTPTPASSSTGTSNTTTAYNGTVPPTGALIVSQTAIDGVTTYETIQDALNAAPTSKSTNATIFIYPGTYDEQLIVNKSGSTIFIGYSESPQDYSQNQVTITQSYGVDTQGDGSDVDAATVYATGNYFYAYNINFRNDNGTQQDIASLGFAVKSSKFASMYGCQVYGNQDTLYISGSYFAYKSYIEGNIDFIFGAGSGYFLNSTIAPNEDGDSITAAKRATNTTAAGFVFDQCQIVPANGVDGSAWKNVSLGRPWNNYANVAYIDSYLASMVGAAGWDQWSKTSPQTDGVTYGEYHNYGPGSNTCGRVSFSEQLTDAQVAAYELDTFFASTAFIDFSVVEVTPFSPGIGTQAAGCANVTTSTTSSTSVSITATVTVTATSKQITTTSVPGSSVVKTSTALSTEEDDVTVTPSEAFKTSVVKATTIGTTTVTGLPKTTTIKSTETDLTTVTTNGKAVTSLTTQSDVETVTTSGKGTTIKVTSVQTLTTTSLGKGTTVKSTSTEIDTTTVAGKSTTSTTTSTITSTSDYTPAASVVKATTTVYVLSTTTPKAVTVTDEEGTVTTVYKTSTPKGASTTSTLTITGSDVTKTTTLKASTITSSTTSTATTTKKTTITCDPAATPAGKLFKRGIQARAAGTATVTVTITTYTKTATITQAGSTYSTVTYGTTTVLDTVTLPKTTSTVLSTSYATSTQTVTEAGETDTFSSLATKLSTVTQTNPASTVTSTINNDSTQTVTIPGSTATSTILSTAVVTDSEPGSTATSLVLATSYITQSSPGSTVVVTKLVTSISTQTEAQSTSTSLKIVTSTSQVTAATPTSTFVDDANETKTATTTLQASTSTVFKTSTLAGKTSTITVTPTPVTKSTTIKSTVTVYSSVTKSKSGAAACTA